jgi:hypothetical protein
VPTRWERLSNGSGKGIVLALDFEAVGRPEACFSDIATILDPPREIWAAAQPPGGLDAPFTADAYLEYWSDGLRESGREVRAVLGFCAGAVFAAALAERIAQWQATTPVPLLLDPELPTRTTLLKQFDNAMRGLAAVAAESELSGMKEALGRLDGAEDLSYLAAELSSLYQQASGPVFSRIGLNSELQADMAASFRSLMSYLVAASDVRAGEGWASGTAIVSAVPIWEPTGVARQIRTHVDHADLLRSPFVATLISELLESP